MALDEVTRAVEEGKRLRQQGRYAEALDAFERALSLAPERSDIWTLQSQTFVNLGRLPEGLAAAERATELDTGDPEPWLSKVIPLLGLDRPTEALEAADHALGMDPPRAKAAWLWAWKSVILLSLVRYEDALDAADRSLQMNPESGVARHARGQALLMLGRNEEALEALDRALRLNPKAVGAWRAKGHALYGLRRFEEALAAHERALDLNPRYAEAWMGKGLALEALRRFQDALAAYDQTIELAPEQGPCWAAKGRVLTELHEYEMALAAFDRALQLNGDQVDWWATKGNVLRILQRPEEALGAYDRALALDPSLVPAWAGKAGALYSLGRYQEAVAASDEAVRLAPDDQDSLTMRRRIQAVMHRSVPDQGMRLRDGRWLAYVDYGDPQGTPVFACHGTPGSRLDFLYIRVQDELLRNLHIRLIVPDRPGYGRSDLPPQFKILDWPADVEQLLDHLGVARCAVFGMSGGGAYAAACASALPQRVSKLGLVSSVAPESIPEVAAALPRIERWQARSPLFRWLYWPRVRSACWAWARNCRVSPERWSYYQSLAESHGRWNAVKQMRISKIPPLPPTSIEGIQEPFRTGSSGLAHDRWVLHRDWGFPLSAISTPTFLWHGERDRNTPLAMGQYLARTIPHCDAHFYPDEGHDLLRSHWEEVLATLVT